MLQATVATTPNGNGDKRWHAADGPAVSGGHLTNTYSRLILESCYIFVEPAAVDFQLEFQCGPTGPIIGSSIVGNSPTEHTVSAVPTGNYSSSSSGPRAKLACAAPDWAFSVALGA